MNKYQILLLSLTFCFFGNIQAGENRLLNLQYINKSADLKELTKSTVYNELGKYIISSISSGDILVDPNNVNNKFMFVLDENWCRIVYFKKDDDWIEAYGSGGTGGPANFNGPQDIAVLSDGSIYVADTYNNRIVKLKFNFSTYLINYEHEIDLGNYLPRSVDVAEDGNNPMFVATTANELLICLSGLVYKYPEDFLHSHDGAAVVNYGAYELDVIEPYVFFIDSRYKKIHYLCFNSNEDRTDFFFTHHHEENYNFEDVGVRKLSIHPAYPNDVAYLLFNNNKLRTKVLFDGKPDLVIPGVEGIPGSDFDHAVAIGMQEDLGDFFVGERWINNGLDWKVFWYALGPEIQNFSHEIGDYENINKFTCTLSELSILKREILKPDGTLLTQLEDNEGTNIYNPGKFEDDESNFNEYFNNAWIPYGTYTYRLTAESAYPHEGESDEDNPITIINQPFEGGALPAEGDIVCSSNYLIQGHTYTLKNYSNSDNYNPPPLYTDTWRLISSQYGSGGKVTDLSETQSPYIATLKTSTASGSKSLNKTSADYNPTDNVGVTMSFGGISTEEATRTFTSHPRNPGACPTLYINDKPYVNLLPASKSVSGVVEDRITLPPDILTIDTLKFKIAETGNDVTTFKSVELVLEDVEKGTNLVRLSSGLSFEYKNKTTLSTKNLAKAAKIISSDYLAGDTLFFSLDQSGDAVMSVSGYLGSNLTPIEYCMYNSGGMQLASVYQVPPSNSGSDSVSNYFIDADYARAFLFANNFALKDTLSENDVRNYIVVFHVDYHLEELNIYYLEDETSNALAKNSSKYDYYFKPKYHVISNNFRIGGKKIPTLKPDGQIEFSFSLPNVGEYYQRYGYLKVVGRYDPYKVSNLDEPNSIPKAYFLKQNYPNPFNPSTTFHFGLPYTSRVTISIYNILGQHIKTIDKKELNAGVHEIIWDGKTDNGFNVSSGLYIFHFQAESKEKVKKNFSKTSKMILLR